MNTLMFYNLASQTQAPISPRANLSLWTFYEETSPAAVNVEEEDQWSWVQRWNNSMKRDPGELMLVRTVANEWPLRTTAIEMRIFWSGINPTSQRSTGKKKEGEEEDIAGGGWWRWSDPGESLTAGGLYNVRGTKALLQRVSSSQDKQTTIE